MTDHDDHAVDSLRYGRMTPRRPRRTLRQRFAAWRARMQLRWQYRRPIAAVTPTAPPPVTQAHESADQKWEKEHGFSVASRPNPFTEDIARHNAAVNKDYADEVEARKAEYARGEYQPRFGIWLEAVEGTPVERVFQVNWDLEMTLRPGARTNVTHEATKQHALLTPQEIAEHREMAEMKRQIAVMERNLDLDAAQDRDDWQKLRQTFGTREDFLKAAGGDEAKADALEAKTLLVVKDARLYLEEQVAKQLEGEAVSNA